MFKELVETKKATNASVFAGRDHDPTLLMASADVTRDGSVDEVRDRLIAILEGAGEAGVAAEEVARSKQQILKAREPAANDTAQMGISLRTCPKNGWAW